MKKRLLTLDNLYSYYVNQNKNIKFNADEEHTSLVVQVSGKASFKKKETNDKEGLLAVHLQANHTQKNLNNSYIEDNVCLNALPSFSDRPILAYLHKVDGEWQFYGHNMHEDEDGNIVYDEIPVGIIPESCNAQLIYDEEKNKSYVEVDGYIFEEYSRAAEVLQREKECNVSVELSIRELEYNAKEKYLNIKDYYYSGVTILGVDEDGNKVNPGMEGSNIKIADFSRENNSLTYSVEQKLIETLDNINSTLSNFNINDTARKEETEMENNKNFEEATEEVIIEESAEETEQTEIVTENEEVATANEESTAEEVDTEEGESESEETPTAESVEETSEEFSNIVRTYEISHEDLRWGLYSLLASYEEADNEYYFITNTYDDYFVYENFNSTKIFGQSYEKDGDNVSFNGERWELFKELLTASEKAELESMRANYSSICEQLNAYQQKEEVENKKILVNSDEYASISDIAEFIELKESVNKEEDKLTYSELKEKADAIQLNAAKSGQLKFSEAPNVSGKTTLPYKKKNVKKTDFGNLFDGIL